MVSYNIHKEFIKLILLKFPVMTTSTPEKQDGLKVLNEAIEIIKATITDLGGVFNIQMAVSTYSLTSLIFPKTQVISNIGFYFCILIPTGCAI